ncbi:MAG: Dyp-type peroxidase [Gemmatimonadetes bacterium]|jgi:porphyrinogen peroxidase|nr:Dyp-type peroxidase [Gemmatimonadota bacterium]MBT6149915.1 Dyp-type peroxidase [Gemmatimonadota bacterium]MBT7860339.1 Dyp-type peroxidase [Gemmatimonadota bacterium]
MTCQPGILDAVPRLARYLSFRLAADSAPDELGTTLRTLAGSVDGRQIVVGIGPATVAAVDGGIVLLRPFPHMVGSGISIPATSAALWCWLRGDDRGVLLHETRRLQKLLSPQFEIEEVVDAFMYTDSRDLSGYEDGTENPEGADAIAAAVVRDAGEGLDGSSFAAVQRWIHDLDRFESMPRTQQDHTIGRRRVDNEEIEDAPDSAHVKRTAQEDFDPEAYVLRRSMPWASAEEEGLLFLAFGHSFNAFEALLKRMIGADDGIPDALFSFTRPVTGDYFWCPPMKGDRLDLRAIGL